MNNDTTFMLRNFSTAFSPSLQIARMPMTMLEVVSMQIGFSADTDERLGPKIGSS